MSTRNSEYVFHQQKHNVIYYFSSTILITKLIKHSLNTYYVQINILNTNIKTGIIVGEY